MAAFSDSSNQEEGTGVIQHVSDITNRKIGTSMDNVMEKLSCLTCSTHPEENILFFCEDHRVDCCVVCIAETHEQCSSVPTEVMFRKFYSHITKIKQLHQNIDDEEENLKSYARQLKSHFLLGKQKIKTVYDEIRKQVNKAEAKTLSQFDDMKEVKLSVISAHFKHYDELRKQIKSILEEGQRLYNNIVSQYDETYSVASEELLKSSSNVEKHTRGIDQYHLSHENDMEKIKEKLNELTEIVKDTNTNFVTKNEQQILNVESSLSDIVHITGVTVRSPIGPIPTRQYLPDGQISCHGQVESMCIIPNTKGEMFIATLNPNRLQRINSQGTVIKYANLPQPFQSHYVQYYDLCVYGGNVAVTIYSNDKIVCFRTSDLDVSATFNMPGNVFGVCRVGNLFVVAFNVSGVVRCVNDSGQIVRSSDKLFSWPTYVRFSEQANCILISHYGVYEIVALSVDLKTVLFKMSHTNLQSPRGFSINEYGRVYVCSHDNNCVVEFTKEGKYESTMLPADQLGITNPFSICYDSGKRRLYVASRSGVIHAYQGQ